MSYLIKPYKEAYRHQLRSLSFGYGLNKMMTIQLNYKLGLPIEAKIQPKLVKLAYRNKLRQNNLRKKMFKLRIKRFTPQRILPLP